MSRPAVGAMVRREVAPEDVAAAARAVEAAGLDEAWLVEDCSFTSAVACAATALAVTERVRLGLGILPVALRNPALAAMELATLARTHPGRLVPGLGHGLEVWMEQVGARPRDRLVALEETLAALRALLGGEEVSREGRRDAQVVVYALLALDDDPAAARDAVRPVVAGWLRDVERPHQLAPLDPSPEDLRTLPDALVDELAVAGDAAGCAAAIRALGEAGATSVVLVALPGRDEEQLARVGAEVLALL